MFKYEMHLHTGECDKGVKIGGADIVKAYKDAGFNGLVVTDHYLSLFYEWFKDELAGKNHREIIDRYLKGYYAARNEGERSGMTVLCGAEVRFNGAINDYLIYGLEPEFFYGAPLLNELKNVNELIDILPDDALVVQAHPFRNNMTICDPSNLFGIEIYNSRTEKFRNEMAAIFAEHYGKRPTSGSDFHSLAELGKGGISTEKEIRNSKDLVSVLKSGQYSLIRAMCE